MPLLCAGPKSLCPKTALCRPQSLKRKKRRLWPPCYGRGVDAKNVPFEEKIRKIVRFAQMASSTTAPHCFVKPKLSGAMLHARVGMRAGVRSASACPRKRGAWHPTLISKPHFSPTVAGVARLRALLLYRPKSCDSGYGCRATQFFRKNPTKRLTTRDAMWENRGYAERTHRNATPRRNGFAVCPPPTVLRPCRAIGVSQHPLRHLPKTPTTQTDSHHDHTT